MLLTARPASHVPAALSRFWQASGRILRHATALLALLALALPAAGAQDAGKVTLTGKVTDIGSGAPVMDVTVKVTGLGIQVRTNAQGVYSIPNLGMGATVAVEASRLGYGVTRKEGIKLDQGIVTLNLTVNQNATSLDAVTTSATTDPASGLTIPMSVAKLDESMMPVPNVTNGALGIQGKVAGVKISQPSGRPGDSSIVQIRAVMSPFRNNGPLYVVDGVPLAATENTASDFLGLDIESIEVIRGAAAASLYGSRASGGVIAITTKRGKDVAVGSSRIDFRQDFGYEDINKMPPKRKAHRFKQNEYGQFVELGSIPTFVGRRVAQQFAIQDQPYIHMYDAVHEAMIGNRSMVSRASISQVTATTNLNLSFNRNRQPGVFKYNDGQTQRNVRFGVSHQLRDNLTIEANMQHTRQRVRQGSPSTSFTGLFEIEPRVTLYAPNTDARLTDLGFHYDMTPDSNSGSFLNPLWVEYRFDYNNLRQRSLINTEMQYRPFNWLTWRTDFGYDKSDNGSENWTQPGWPTTQAGQVGSGALRYTNSSADQLTFNSTASVLRDFGRLTTTMSLKGHQDRQRNLSFSGDGTPIGLGSRTLTGSTDVDVTSSTSETRANNVSLNLKADYGGKYILDALVLREGNSRFGPEDRWHNFYRASGSWLFSEEAWYPSFLNKLTLAKFRANWGTAGGEPSFSDQFEQVGVSNNIGFTRGTLGNPDLAPEIRNELETGADFIYNNKISFQFSYSRQTLKDAITPAVAPAVTGYASVQSNVGETRGESWEATIEGTLVSTQLWNRRFQWRTNLVGSRDKSTIIDLGRPCYGQGTFHYVCDRTPMTDIWGYRNITSHDELDAAAPSYTPYRDWWQVNDEGFLVSVGPGNNYWEGFSKNLWGTSYKFHLGSPAGIFTYKTDFGIPYFQRKDSTGGQNSIYWQKLGDSQQLFDFGLNNTFNYGNFQFHVSSRGALGGDIYNRYRYGMYEDNLHPDVDQYHKPDSLKKPIWQFSGGSPGTGDGFAGFTPNSTYGFSEFVEKANWMKLSELQVAYAMNARDYKFLDRVGITRINGSLSGTNIYLFKGKYSGIDPEGFSNRDGGRFRYDASRYPPTRNYSGSITVVF